MSQARGKRPREDAAESDDRDDGREDGFRQHEANLSDLVRRTGGPGKALRQLYVRCREDARRFTELVIQRLRIETQGSPGSKTVQFERDSAQEEDSLHYDITKTHLSWPRAGGSVFSG